MQKRLRKWRKTLGVSQFRLAQTTGISRFRLSLFESGYLKLTRQEIDKIKRSLKRLSERSL